MHSHCLSFDNFTSLICSFRTSNMEEKIERFFRLIDEDGNGMLSYDEIYNLCTRSFKSYQDFDAIGLNKGKNDEFYKKLSEYFARYIFKCVNMDLD